MSEPKPTWNTGSKYGNKKVSADGYVFDSKAEYHRYNELKLLLRVGEITDLKVHPRYEIQKECNYLGKKIKPIYYEADFEYMTTKAAHLIIEDVKGMRTDVYKLKKKMMLKILSEGIERNGQIWWPEFIEVMA